MAMAPAAGSAPGENGEVCEVGDQCGWKVGEGSECWDDAAYVRKVVSVNGCLLGWASDRLADDADTAKLAVRDTPLALQYVSDRLWGDQEVLDVVLSEHGIHALVHAPPQRRDDRNYMRKLMARDAAAFMHASPRLRKNARLARLAVAHDGRLLVKCSESLRDDEELVRAAVRQCGMALNYASDRLRGDEETVRTAVRQCGTALCYARERLCDDEVTVRAAVQQNGEALQFATARLRDDKDVVRAALRAPSRACPWTANTSPGATLVWASRRLREDEETALCAVSTYGYMDPLLYVSDELWDAEQVWRRAALVVHWEQVRALLLLGRYGSDGVLPQLPGDVIAHCIDVLASECVAQDRLRLSCRRLSRHQREWEWRE